MLLVILSVLLGHADCRVREAAHEGLAMVATPAELMPLLDSPDPEIRMRASLLLDEVGHAELRRYLLSFATLPYIDADPTWTGRGWQRYLTQAMDWHREAGRPMGEAAGWPEYRLATLLAMDSGALWYDPLAWPVLQGRTAKYLACRRWE